MDVVDAGEVAERFAPATPRRKRDAPGSRDRPPLDRDDSSSPCSASAASNPRLQVVHLGLRAKPEPQGKVRRQQRHMLAGGASDLDEIASPQVLSRDTRRESAPSPDQVKMARYQAAMVRLPGVTTTSQKPSRFWIIFFAFSRRVNTASVRSGM
jgi:hypothetical protein